MRASTHTPPLTVVAASSWTSYATFLPQVYLVSNITAPPRAARRTWEPYHSPSDLTVTSSCMSQKPRSAVWKTLRKMFGMGWHEPGHLSE